MCQEFSLSLGQSSGASVLPWVAGAVTANMAGWAADTLVNKVSGGRDRASSSAGGAVRHIDVMWRRSSTLGALVDGAILDVVVRGCPPVGRVRLGIAVE